MVIASYEDKKRITVSVALAERGSLTRYGAVEDATWRTTRGELAIEPQSSVVRRGSD